MIGNSMGGYIAAWLAATYPDRIASLALIDPAGVTAPQASDMERHLARGHNPFLINSREEFRQFYAMTMASPPWVPGLVLDAIAQRYQRQRDELEEIFRDFRASPPMEPKLAEIKCPALLLWGRKDRLIDVSSVPVWSKGIANLRVEVWDGVGHMPMVEQPGILRGCIGSFWAVSDESHNYPCSEGIYCGEGIHPRWVAEQPRFQHQAESDTPHVLGWAAAQPVGINPLTTGNPVRQWNWNEHSLRRTPRRPAAGSEQG